MVNKALAEMVRRMTPVSMCSAFALRTARSRKKTDCATTNRMTRPQMRYMKELFGEKSKHITTFPLNIQGTAALYEHPSLYRNRHEMQALKAKRQDSKVAEEDIAW